MACYLGPIGKYWWLAPVFFLPLDGVVAHSEVFPGTLEEALNPVLGVGLTETALVVTRKIGVVFGEGRDKSKN